MHLLLLTAACVAALGEEEAGQLTTAEASCKNERERPLPTSGDGNGDDQLPAVNLLQTAVQRNAPSAVGVPLDIVGARLGGETDPLLSYSALPTDATAAVTAAHTAGVTAAPTAAVSAVPSMANVTTACVPAAEHCACTASDPSWVRTNRTSPRSVFIDLGAADGNSFMAFKHRFTGQPKESWQAILVEANPVFTDILTEIAANYSGRVQAIPSRPAQTCERNVSFHLDNSKAHNYWGSSIGGGDHRTEDWSNPDDMSRLSHRSSRDENAVQLRTVNLMRLLYENTIPGDSVMVKMDIEGAEWDIVPCLARSPAAALLDELDLEVHPANWQQGCTTPQEMHRSLETLRRLNVSVPKYFSPTL